MSDQIRVIGPRDRTKREGEMVIMTVSISAWKGLSPFVIGPCMVKLEGGIKFVSLNMENAWQFSKLYAEHADDEGNPTRAHWSWARKGWDDIRPHRYPMGKGAKPLCSLWNGERLNYIQARKKIYIPLYRKAVKLQDDYKKLKRIVKTGKQIALWDFDGYDHEARFMTLKEVINEPNMKMGHAFVLKMMLMYGEDFKIKDIP